jgi:hypothetical protein
MVIMLTVVGFVNQLARFIGPVLCICKEIIKDDMMVNLVVFYSPGASTTLVCRIEPLLNLLFGFTADTLL